MKFVGPGVDIELVGDRGAAGGFGAEELLVQWRLLEVGVGEAVGEDQEEGGGGRGGGKKTVHEEKEGWRRGSIRKEKKMEER